MFYDSFLSLCVDKGVKPGRAADEMGINRATVTSWKKAGYNPRAEQLDKIAKYFEVPVDFLLQRPPFEYWEKIEENRAEFFHYVDFDPELLDVFYDIDSNLLEAEPIRPIIIFMNEQVESAQPLEKGGWEVKMKNTKKAPTQQPGERSTAQNDEEEEMLLLARHMEPIPEEDRKELKEQFKKSIDMYLKAMGLSETEDK